MSTEGRIPFRGYETWYRIVGDRKEDGKLPLLCLHGGPGATHDYLEPLEAVSETGRRVVFYDQLGCGKSDLPGNPQSIIYPNASHMAHVEDTPGYIRMLDGLLSRVEAASRIPGRGSATSRFTTGVSG